MTSAHAGTIFPLGEIRRYEPRWRPDPELYPFIQYVPKDLIGQLKWRLYVRRRCLKDAEFRAAIYEMCRRDMLFFANTFGMVFEPRPFPQEKPLNTWPDQDFALWCMEECFGERDLGREKSRGVGASWDIIILSYHKWEFGMRQQTDSTIGVTIGFVSRSENAVDSDTDPDSLMWKLDFLYSWMPVWMRLMPNGKKKLDRSYDKHRFANLENGGTIFGYAATGDVTTGGRKTAMFMDEFGKFPLGADQYALDSTQYVTNSRFFISTYKNDNNRFYQLMHDAETSMLRLISDWKDNPERAAGMYTVYGGKLKIIDTSYPFPPNYRFELNPKKGGMERSPWYDAECNRPGATARSIAREIDRDARGASSKYFASRTIQKAMENVREPSACGDLLYDSEDFTPTWRPSPTGRFQFWDLPIDSRGKVGHSGPFVISLDVATGNAGEFSSNSALVVTDITKGQVVGGFLSNAILPHELARMTFALIKWLCNGRDHEHCFLIWENMGPGVTFWVEFKKFGFSNYYWRTTDPAERTEKRIKKIGWWKTDSSIDLAFSNLQDAILQERFLIPWKAAILELNEYEYNKSGKIVHVASSVSEDGSTKNAAHGDVAIALAIGHLGFAMKKHTAVKQITKSVDKEIESELQFERDYRDRQLRRQTDDDWGDMPLNWN